MNCPISTQLHRSDLQQSFHPLLLHSRRRPASHTHGGKPRCAGGRFDLLTRDWLAQPTILPSSKIRTR
jgi:hypothetical protein